ncbi:MAG: acyl-CoA thioesterase [Alloprevotella sp.]|nr:acyl-CoA thioesterase [Alloprevotella sp.]
MAISFDSLNFKHKMPIQIRFNDVDRYGHVNNNAYFSYYDLGKVDYFNAVMKHDIAKSTDIVPVVVNLQADFFFPVFYGDDIVVETCISHIGSKSFTLAQRAVNQDTGQVVCQCQTIMVCFSLEAKESVPMPQSFREAIENFEK